MRRLVAPLLVWLGLLAPFAALAVTPLQQAILFSGPSVLPGAAVDYNFTAGTYWQAGISYGTNPANYITTSRASVAYIDDLSGNWTQFSANRLRVSNKGALIEEGRTNGIRNNTMQGAVAGTPGTLPTNWGFEGTTPTYSVVGTGVDSGIAYIDIAFSGSATFALDFEDIASIAAVQNQTWTASNFVKLTGGSLTNMSMMDSIEPLNSVGGVLTSGNNTAFTPTSSWTRPAYSYVLPDATTAFVRSRLRFGASGAFSFTLRIGWPQMELGVFATSPIATTNAAVTRASDVVTLTNTPVFGVAYTLMAQATPGGDAATNFIAFQADANSTNNRAAVFRSIQAPNALSVSGGTPTALSTADVWTVGSSKKLALAVTAGDQAFVYAGGTVQTGSGALPIGPLTNVRIGSNSLGTGSFNGYIGRAAIWPTTRLPNATLQSLTQ